VLRIDPIVSPERAGARRPVPLARLGPIGRSGLLVLAVLLALGSLASPIFAQAQNSPPQFSQGDELVQLDFRDVELTVVIETIAKITGQNFIYDDRVRGRVTIVSPSEISVDQAFAVFESVLKVKGFTAVPGPGGVLKIVPVRDAKESSIETIKDGRRSRNRDNFVTRLVPLLYIDADAITNTIKPLVSKEASMVAYPPTNTIIITDTEANIRRLLSILEAIDVETYKEELAVIKVEYADAATLGEQISQIYGANVASAGPTSGGTTTAARRSSSRRSSRRSSSSGTPAAGSLFGQSAATRGKVRLMTDDRTNSLLVLASRTQLDDIRKLVRQLDVPLVGQGRIHVHYLRYADAEEMAQTLNGMLSGQRPSGGAGRTGGAGGNQPQQMRAQVTALSEGGINLNADPATNSLVIQASKESYEALLQVIKQLDIPRPQVLVEALILEVDITNGLELGVQALFDTVNGDTRFAFSTLEQAFTGTSAGQLATIAKQAFDYDENGQPEEGAEGTNMVILMKAAARAATLNIVSSPHILTSDNEEAEIRVGNNIPIITSRVNNASGNVAGLSTSVNVERQDIGVTLRVTPQISEGDQLRLKIFQEITDINEELTIGVGDPEQVGVSLFNRKIENTVVVNNGDTVVVGGLISDRWVDGESKVPWLGDIPVIGWGFKTVRKDLRKINTLVFLTPHIVRNEDQMELESIRKRDEFQNRSGKGYDTDDENLRRIDDESKADDKWSPNQNPVLHELRDLSSRYSLRRRDELLEVQRETEADRRASRLDRDGQTVLVYALRVGVYRDETTAAADLTRVLDAGYDGTLVSGEADGALLYELVVGPFADMQGASEVGEVLREVYDFAPSVTVLEVEGSSGEEDGAEAESAP
jgi:general secretion pathway protein D